MTWSGAVQVVLGAFLLAAGAVIVTNGPPSAGTYVFGSICLGVGVLAIYIELKRSLDRIR